MTVIPGLSPVGAPVSIETSANTDLLNQYPLWQESGVSFTPRGCIPAQLAEAACVPCTAADDPRFCSADSPEPVHFAPFWVYMSVNSCPFDGIDYLGQVRDDLQTQRSSQIARALHSGVGDNPSLQSAAVNISGGTASSPSEAFGSLLRAVGDYGLTGGVFYGPAYTIPTLLDHGLVTLTGGTYTTTLGVPYISDFGFGTEGPQGAEAPNGSAWVYWSPSRPAVAVSNRIDPPGSGDDRIFLDRAAGCFTPMARQRAIAVFNPCATFATLMDVRECSPCAPLANPTPAPDPITAKRSEASK